MEKYLQYFIYIPFLGYVLSLMINKKREAIIANIALGTSFIQLVFLIGFSFSWYLAGALALDIKQVTLLTTPEFDFFIDFFFDQVSLVFLFVGSILTLLVSVFSKYYIHREPGFKRYFNNVQLFFLGYSIVVVAGPDTLKAEPLKNATKIPPTIPEIIPANNGAPEANALPKHKGNATKKTTKPAGKSSLRYFKEKLELDFD